MFACVCVRASVYCISFSSSEFTELLMAEFQSSSKFLCVAQHLQLPFGGQQLHLQDKKG